MRNSKFSKLLSQLTLALSPATLNTLALTTGFSQRLRAIEPAALALSLVACLGSQRIETLADLHRVYQAQTGSDVRYDSFHERLAHPHFATFMCAVLNQIINLLRLQVLRALPGNPFGRFHQILIQDGTNFALHDALVKFLPGRFFKTQPAAVALHTTMDLLQDEVQQITLTPDKWSERDYLPRPESLWGKLLLGDRGYGSAVYFRDVDQAGGFYLIRGRKNWNPLVTGIWQQGQLQALAKPIRLQVFLSNPANAAAQTLMQRYQWRGHTKHRQVTAAWDLQVLWTVEKVNHLGRIIWQANAKDPVMLCTNLPWSEFDTATVLQAYRLRWQVELMFKEWKSYANLQAFETRSLAVAVGVIWACITTAILKRFLAHAAQVVHRVPISTRKMAMLGQNWLGDLIVAALQELPNLEQIFRNCLRLIAQQAKRSCKQKEHRSGRMKLGLAVVYSI